MTQQRKIDVARLRREQIIDAAAAIISEQGIDNLSLSAIEAKADMSRGQLTYYFPAKEDILLAVFDRVLCHMYQRLGQPNGEGGVPAGWWDWVQHLMSRLILEPPISPEFSGLQYTFLAQSSHRTDFRQRLAKLYEEWRGNMSQGMACELAQPQAREFSPRAMASVVQALLHGLGMQLAADPDAFSRRETVNLCLDMLSTYVWGETRAHLPRAHKAARNGRHRTSSNGKAKAKLTHDRRGALSNGRKSSARGKPYVGRI
jgi:AcrR family transcriptional regulator